MPKSHSPPEKEVELDDIPVAHPAPDEKHDPTLFSNDRGNLKITIVLCLPRMFRVWYLYSLERMHSTTTASVATELRGKEIGQIITDGQAEYDLFDTRSIKQDSYRMAIGDVMAARQIKEQEESEELEREMSGLLGIIMWIYEAKTGDGIFTQAAAKSMMEAELRIVGHPEFPEWCQRDYEQYENVSNPNFECRKFALSPLRFLYASSFDTDKARRVIDALQAPNILAAYKRFGRCFEFPPPPDMPQRLWEATCDPDGVVPEQDRAAAREISALITEIMDAWDGKGQAPVSDMTTLSEFVSWMHVLPTRSMHVDFFLDSNFSVEHPVSGFSRTILGFGGPLPRDPGKGATPVEGGGSSERQEAEERAKLKKWMIAHVLDDIEACTRGDFSADVTVYYFMTAIIFDVILKILISDAIKVIFSISAVFIYIWTAVGSLFLAIVGMSEIILSIPVAWFVSRILLRVQYFGGLNMLTIFIVCAIGADDIFVFMDAYVQSQYKGASVVRDLPTRMSWVYRKSGIAMFITSATTCASFLCCLATPIPGTQAFGIFAALVIAVDYILVMTMFCTAVIVYHNRFEKPPLCSFAVPTPLGTCRCGCCCENCSCQTSDPSPTEKALAASQSQEDMQADPIEHFFRNTFAPIINQGKYRLAAACVLIAWLVPAIIWVFKLKPTVEQEQSLSSKHPLQKAISVINTQFGASSEDVSIPIFYVWGLRDLSRNRANILYNVSYLGEARYNDNFELSPLCQEKIYQICEDLRLRNNTEEYLSMIKRDDSGAGAIDCFMYDLQARAEEAGWGSSNFRASSFECKNATRDAAEFAACISEQLPTNLTLPANSSAAACTHLQHVYRCVPNACCDNSEIKARIAQLEAQLTPQLQVVDRACARGAAQCADNRMSASEVAAHMDEFVKTSYPGKEEYVGWDGTRLRYVAISVWAPDLTQYNRPAEEVTRRAYNSYDGLRRKIDDIAQDACGSKVMMTDLEGKFVFMNNQKIYRTSAVSGALIGVGIAFAVLLLCTRSLTITVLSTLSILATMMSVIGLTTMMGWTLGTTEAIQISVLAGFSVDYVVHLAHAYSHSHGSRKERTTAAFSEMGAPVLSGMITSVLASLPLFLCEIQFFAKFGTFLCFTILFSWTFANFGFMSLVATFGPEDHLKHDSGCGEDAHSASENQAGRSSQGADQGGIWGGLVYVLPGLDPKTW